MLVCLPVGSCPRCSACWPCWWCPCGRRCWSRPPRPCPRPPDHPYQGVVYWEGCCSSRNGSRVRIPESGSRLTVNSFPSDLRLKIENFETTSEKYLMVFIISVWWFCRGQTVWHLPPPRLWIFDMVLNLFGWWKPTPAPTPPTSVIPPPPMALLGAYALLPRVVPRKYKKYRNCLGKHGCIFLRKPKQKGVKS